MLLQKWLGLFIVAVLFTACGSKTTNANADYTNCSGYIGVFKNTPGIMGGPSETITSNGQSYQISPNSSPAAFAYFNSLNLSHSITQNICFTGSFDLEHFYCDGNPQMGCPPTLGVVLQTVNSI